MYYVALVNFMDEDPDNTIIHVSAYQKRNDDAIWKHLLDLSNNDEQKSKEILKSLTSEKNVLMIYFSEKGVMCAIKTFEFLKTFMIDFHCHPNVVRRVDSLENGDGVWITFNQKTADKLSNDFEGNVEYNVINT